MIATSLERLMAACKELADKTGQTELAPMIQTMLAENDGLKEQVAQLEIKNSLQHTALEDYGITHDQQQETLIQQAAVIEQMRKAVQIGLDFFPVLHQAEQRKMQEAFALQPSPESLLARDQRVAEACAKVCEKTRQHTEIDSALHAAESIRSGKWRKYL